MTITIKLKDQDEYLRLPKDEAEQLVRKGKARFADRSEWKRWRKTQNEQNEPRINS